MYARNILCSRNCSCERTERILRRCHRLSGTKPTTQSRHQKAGAGSESDHENAERQIAMRSKESSKNYIKRKGPSAPFLQPSMNSRK